VKGGWGTLALPVMGSDQHISQFLVVLLRGGIMSLSFFPATPVCYCRICIDSSPRSSTVG
jgi:hypothetical protein